MGIEEVRDGGGNVHAAEGLKGRVSFVLPHPSADEGVGGHVVVAGQLWGGCRDAVKVHLHAEVGYGIAHPGVCDKFKALWGR